MEMSIFGLGYVGSVSAACFAEQGHNIIGVDTNKTKVEMTNAGKAVIIEPELCNLIENNVKKGRLTATTHTKDAIINSELSFICVGTPSKQDHSIDLQYVKNICEDIGYALKNKNQHHTVVCRSTMLPGTVRKHVIPTLERFSGKKEGDDFNVFINPEFMMEGTAVYDFYNPPKNVVGTNDIKACRALVELNQSYTNLPTQCMDIESAELIKYCDNIWHALKVGYANEIGNVCKRLGVDSHKVMEVFCSDTKLNISPYYLKPGYAFGGSCLPKDLRAFIHESKNLNVNIPIISSVLPSNRLQIENGIDLVIEQGNKKVGVLGFSFKANTDDLRESPVLELIERLLGKGYDLMLYDKNVNEALLNGHNDHYFSHQIPHIVARMVSSIHEVLTHSRTIVIGNKSKEFANVINQLNSDQVIVDLVRITDSHHQHKQYNGICW